MADYYVLKPEIGDGKVPVPVDDLHEWAAWYERSSIERTVARSTVGPFRVSTVFLGLDHQYDPTQAEPHLFETMVFDSENVKELHGDQYEEEVWPLTRRCGTWECAEHDHREVVEEVRKMIADGKGYDA